MPHIPKFTMPEIPEMKTIPEHAFDALVEEMRRFQNKLQDDVEVGIVANGAGLVIHVNSLRFSSQMIVFDSEGRDARLIQHYTQVNVQMIAVPKLEEEPRRIGF